MLASVGCKKAEQIDFKICTVRFPVESEDFFIVLFVLISVVSFNHPVITFSFIFQMGMWSDNVHSVSLIKIASVVVIVVVVCFSSLTVSNDNWTEWSTIQGVIR